jgi:hypothetical protein
MEIIEEYIEHTKYELRIISSQEKAMLDICQTKYAHLYKNCIPNVVFLNCFLHLFYTPIVYRVSPHYETHFPLQIEAMSNTKIIQQNSIRHATSYYYIQYTDIHGDEQYLLEGDLYKGPFRTVFCSFDEAQEFCREWISISINDALIQQYIKNMFDANKRLIEIRDEMFEKLNT